MGLLDLETVFIGLKLAFERIIYDDVLDGVIRNWSNKQKNGGMRKVNKPTLSLFHDFLLAPFTIQSTILLVSLCPMFRDMVEETVERNVWRCIMM